MQTDSPVPADQASQTRHPISTSDRRARPVHVFVGIGAAILLAIMMRALRNHENGIHFAGLICFGWLYGAFREHVFQLGDWLEIKLSRNRPVRMLKPIATKRPSGEDWYGMLVGISVFFALGTMITIIEMSGGLAGLGDW